MKNYDVKSSVMDLGKISKITITGKRLAYLVPNMFNKITSGYGKKIVIYLSSQVKPEPVQVEVPVASVMPATVNQIAQNTESTTVKNPNMQSEAKNNADTTFSEATDKIKNYIVKVSPMDIDYLRSKQLRVVSIPRKLLISTVFIQKLILHRVNSTNSHFNDNKKIDSPVSSIPVVKQINPKDAGIVRYVELMNKRKEALVTKQQCEKEMTELVNEFGITLDMVNAELAKGKNEIG